MRTEIAVIDDLASFDLWRRQLHSLTMSKSLPAAQFQLRELSCEQNRSYSAASGKLQEACGCASGGLLMSVTVVALIARFVVSEGISNISLLGILSFLGITIVAIFAGKAVGLSWARWRLLRLATHVRSLIVGADQRQITASIS